MGRLLFRERQVEMVRKFQVMKTQFYWNAQADQSSAKSDVLHGRVSFFVGQVYATVEMMGAISFSRRFVMNISPMDLR